MHLLIPVMRGIAFVLGGSLVYVSLAFTKTQDGLVQNWLVDLWVRIESLSSDGRGRVVKFFNETAALMSCVLDRVFGPKLLSPHFVLTSTCLSITSLYFFSVIRYNEHAYGRVFYLGLLCASALIVDAVVRNPSLKVALPLTVLSIITLIAPEWYWGRCFEAVGITGIWWVSEYAGIALGICLDAAFVAIVRMVLRTQQNERQLKSILRLMMINLALGMVLLAPSVPFVKDNQPVFELAKIHPKLIPLLWSLVISSTTNLFAALCALSLVIAALLAVCHRVWWNAASRFVHVVYERRIVENRILLFTCGAALLSYSTHWFDWVRQIPH